MKRKFLSAVLLGVFAIASTSTFVSCKDYDDDIDQNRSDIATLTTQATALQAALKAAQADATQALANAKTAQATADQAVKDAATAQASADAAAAAAKNAQATGDAAAAAAKTAQATADAATAAAKAAQATADEANLKAAAAAAAAAQAKIDAINEAKSMVDSLAGVMNSELAKKVDLTTYNAKIEEIAGKISAIDENLNQLTITVNGKAEKADLDNEVVARKAADADLQNQINTLTKFKEQIEALNLSTFITNTNKSISDLTTKLDKTATDLAAQIAKEAGDVTDLTSKIEGVKTSLATTNDRVSALETWQKDVKTTLDNLQKDLAAAQTDIKTNAKSISDLKIAMEKADKLLQDQITDNYKTLTSEIDQLNIFVKQILKGLVFKPNFYYGGIQAMEAAYINYNAIKLDAYKTLTKDGETYTTATGESSLTPEVTAEYHLNPSSADVKSIKSLSFVSDDKDYVAIGGSRTAACNPTVKSFTAADGILNVKVSLDASKVAKSTSQVTVMALQANIAAKSGEKDTTITSDYAAICSSHITNLVLSDTLPYREGCTIGKFHLWKTAKEAINAPYTHELEYSNKAGIDLSTFVRTHFLRNGLQDEKIMENVENYGMHYEYAVAGYLNGIDGKTNESSYVKIDSKNPSVVVPAYPDSVEAIYHQPLIRVTLIDDATKAIVAIGYVKLEIVRTATDKGPQQAFKNDDGKNVYLGCSDYSNTINYDQILKQIGTVVSKQEFIANYTLQMLNADGAVCKQYKFESTKDKYSVITGTGTVTFADNTLKWTLTAKEIYDIYVTKKQTSATATVLFKSNNTSVRPDVYVTFTLGQINIPTAVLDNATKISNYWAKTNGELGSGYEEIHNHVEVYGQTNANCEFNNDINTTLVGNWPALTLDSKFTDFAKDKLAFTYKFVAPTNPTVKGAEDTYTYVISADGYTLSAKSAKTGVTEVVATINTAAGDLTSDMASIVSYKNTKTAEDILNAAGHKDLANTATALVGLFAKSCFDLPITNNLFNIKFLRPINVDGVNADPFTDAVDGLQSRNIFDMVNFTDWRDYAFNVAYFQYYGVTGVKPMVDANGVIQGVTTNMNGGTLGTTLLSSITKDVKLSTDAADVTPGSTNFGKIYYQNNGNVVSTFTVRIPLYVTYKWGTLKAYTDIVIKHTQANAKSR